MTFRIGGTGMSYLYSPPALKLTRLPIRLIHWITMY